MFQLVRTWRLLFGINQICRSPCVKPKLAQMTQLSMTVVRLKSTKVGLKLKLPQLEEMKHFARERRKYTKLVTQSEQKVDWNNIKIKFLLRVLHKNGRDLDGIRVEDIRRYLQTLHQLELLGCRWYAVAQDVSILDLAQDDLCESEQWLSLHGYPVNVSTLSLISRSGDDEDKIQRLREWIRTKVDVTDTYSQLFNGSEVDLVTLFYNNPSLAQMSSKMSVSMTVKKMVMLLCHNVPASEICRCSSYLRLLSPKRLQQRLELFLNDQLSGMPIRDIYLQNSYYMKPHSKGSKGEPEESKLIFDSLCQCTGVDRNVIAQTDVVDKLLNVSQKKLPDVYVSIKWLCDLGVPVKDILNNIEFVLSLTNFKRTQIISEHTDSKTRLANIKSLMYEHDANKKRPHTKGALARVLKCNTKSLPGTFPRDVKILSTDHDLLSTNLEYLLTDCGFEQAVIQRLPFILCQDTEDLHRAWRDLCAESAFDEWSKDPWRLLNMLQLYVERGYYATRL